MPRDNEDHGYTPTMHKDVFRAVGNAANTGTAAEIVRVVMRKMGAVIMAEVVYSHWPKGVEEAKKRGLPYYKVSSAKR